MLHLTNISLFSNAGIGEYGTNNIINNNFKITTKIANELLETRANIYKENYPYCNMIQGDITSKKIIENLINEINKIKPDIGTFSPPCQGSSGLNSFKGNSNDFRNQLIKSIFQLLDKSNLKENLKFGYIENVTSYYNEEIPALIYKNLNNNFYLPELYHEYIKTSNNKILNYKYFIFSNKKEDLKKFNLEIFISNTKEFFIGFNDLSEININSLNDLITQIKIINNKMKLIIPIKIKDYIEKSLKFFNYDIELKNIRGEEYGAAQIRQRGFCIFYKTNLKLKFPKPIYLISKKENYNGKTLLDSFLVNNLIKIFNKKDFDKNKYKNYLYKENNNKIYIDLAITINEAQKELNIWKQNNYDNKKLPNLHFYQPLKDRFKIWIENTEEGKSAYINKSRIHRPYKLIKITKTNVKLEHNFVIKEDTKSYFYKNNILDYNDYINDKILKQENNNKEWCYGGRNWMLKKIQVRKELENKIIKIAKSNLIKENKDYYLIFFPIKGFEAATYKRNSLNKPINALTTKMGYGNSNTGHPIFDRLLTPAEVMSLFGLGYILKNGNYIKSKNYIPPKNIKNIKTFQNIIFEICGEAIISTVAEAILNDLSKQFYQKNF